MLLTILTAWDSARENILAEIIEKYRDKLVAIAYGIVDNNEDAEEVVGDTFLEAYFHMDDFIGIPESDKIRLLVIYTKNNARDYLRKRKRKKYINTASLTYIDENTDEVKEYEIPDTSSAPENVILNEENRRKIASYVDLLSEEQHDVVVLKYYFGMNDKTIAKRLKISVTAVSSRLTRARKTLREMMEGEFYE